MFTRGMWYTPQQIITLKNNDDVIFIEGVSFTDEELVNDFSDSHFRFYTHYYIKNNDGTHCYHQMFTLIR